ncbi:MAG: uracil-DNA glycosylase [Alphaproteobacteria bacterium]|nr:uracil-DNA glycosylase [Alphaproteobacteria bacterium]MBN2675338.1 uracil-DNA glycosylase [Alphaproteobacteria bacterium]
MGTNSLCDLKLAGVKWELVENLDASKETFKPNDLKKNSSKTNNSISFETSVIPPVAPINVSVSERISKTVNNLSELSDVIKSFNHPLRQFVKNTILPNFTKSSSLLIITDAPSSDDDTNGSILSGIAGEMLDKMLSAIGLNRNNVSILPLVFWRTPGGRTPTREELDLTRPFINRTIDLLKPKIILTLGALTATELIDAKLPKNHGNIMENPDGIQVIPIYHPNYLILKPDSKKDVWEALQKLQNLLKVD